MRLLKWFNSDVSLNYFSTYDRLPPYVILSHTWSEDEEVTFQELNDGSGKSKAGYKKIKFCGKQAAEDGLEYFWVDTCCIDKTDPTELPMSINSMFKWYQNAAKCYVFLPDVPSSENGLDYEPAFRNSRWFTRGWTLQELIAPSSVEFFSSDYKQFGDKLALEALIHQITDIPVDALREFDTAKFSIDERVSWVSRRNTKYEEDLAYCLLGINAFRRLRMEAESLEREISVQEHTNRIEVDDCVVLCITRGLKTCQIANEFSKKWRNRYPNGRIYWKDVRTFHDFEQTYGYIAQELAISGVGGPHNDTLTMVRNWLNEPENGPWLLILDNTNDLSLFFDSNSSSHSSSNLLISDFLPKSAQAFMVVSTHDESIGQRLTSQEEEIVITSLNTRGAEELLRSKRPVWKSKCDRISKAQLEQLLRSLRNGDMNTRRNQIVKNHPETFAWIFDREGQRPWDSFSEWLSSSSDKLYWIRGKAGSGKSTLMKFIIEADETRKYLNQRAPNHKIYSYFIWRAGSPMQRSLIGLISSLVYQIFDNSSIVENILERWPQLSKAQNNNYWSIESLEQVLLHSLSLHRQPICVFIDGLDEIDPDQSSCDLEGPYRLLELIKSISSSSTKVIKICVSSCPENSFNFSLNHCPQLQLQDLTRGDVATYTRSFIRSRCSFNFKGTSYITEESFIEEVVNRTDGVFLWVSLTLQSLQRGMTSGDRPEELMARLLKLTRKLEELYENMFERLGEDRDLFKQTAAFYFNTFIAISKLERIRGTHARPIRWNLLSYATAFDPALRDRLIESKCPKDLKKFILEFAQRLTARCAGLLEVVWVRRAEAHLSPGNLETTLSQDKEKPWEEVSIQFIHRSALEFPLNSRSTLLDIDKTPHSDRTFHILQAIALDDVYPRKYYPDDNYMMEFIANTDSSLSKKQELDLFDLSRDLYMRNSWSHFYELAARHGFQQCYGSLFNDRLEDPNSLQNYLLLCCMVGHSMKTNAMAADLLKKGASPNWLGIVPIELNYGNGPEALNFVTPLLGRHFHETIERRRPYYHEAQLQNMIEILVKSGAELDQRFLSQESDLDKTYVYRKKTRPGGWSSMLDKWFIIVETNCIDKILNDMSENGGGKYDRKFQQYVPTLGQPYRKILLYGNETNLYGVIDEDSDTINKLFGWPESCYSKVPVPDNIEEQVLEVLCGKEVVGTAAQYLTGRGYKLAEESGLEGISNDASIFEMAEIYRKLNEKFGETGD